jgi:hypothetical protein
MGALIIDVCKKKPALAGTGFSETIWNGVTTESNS